MESYYKRKKIWPSNTPHPHPPKNAMIPANMKTIYIKPNFIFHWSFVFPSNQVLEYNMYRAGVHIGFITRTRGLFVQPRLRHPPYSNMVKTGRCLFYQQPTTFSASGSVILTLPCLGSSFFG